MPIQLSKEDQNSSVVITLDQYEAGRLHFDEHYFLSESAPFGGQDFNVLWDDLNNAVNQFVATSGVELNAVAIRFVHCFNISSGQLYLRAQICTMEPEPIVRLGYNFYPLDTSNQAWYELQDGNFTPTADETLIGVEYFEQFFYKIPKTDVFENLVDGGTEKYVRTLVFPWQTEILQMYLDNGSPAGASINFGACSYTESIPGTEAVMWPHGLVMYLSDANGKKLLNNQDYISLFHNKGADFGTQCPPICNGYLDPNS